MKFFKFLISALAAVVMLTSCDEQINPDNPNEPLLLDIDAESLEFSAAGGSETITLTSNAKWEVESTESWLSVSPNGGDAPAEPIEVTVEVAENKGAARTAEVVFSVDTLVKVLTVSQLAGEDGPDVPGDSTEVDLTNWGILGEFNGWANDVPMEVDPETGYLVAYSVELTDGFFKIRQNASWEEGNGNVGLDSVGTVDAGYVYDIINSFDARDMYAKAGTYDIWLDLEGLQLYLMPAGEDIANAQEGTPGEYNPEPGPEPIEDSWYLVGSFNGWTVGDTAYEMTKEGEYYVFKGFELLEDCLPENDGGVKFVYGASWTENRGGEWTGVNVAAPVMLDGVNLLVPAGRYDVYLTAETDIVYFMEEGLLPGEGQPVIPEDTDWHLVGSFNGWVAGDPAYTMTAEGEYFVFRGFEVFESEVEMKFNYGSSWEINRGGDFTAVNEAVAVVYNGNNIKVPAGTYDVYLCADEAVDYAYFMEPGMTPVHPQEQPEPMTFEITAEYTTYEGVECWVGTILPSDPERYYIPGYVSDLMLESWADEGSIAEPTIESLTRYYSDAVKELASDYELAIEHAVKVFLEGSGTKGTVTLPTDVMKGKNYFIAFTLDDNAEVEGLTYNMFHEVADEPGQPAENVYTSNVDITSNVDNGTKVYAEKATIDGAEYDVLKLGTSKLTGSYTTPALGVESGDYELSFYAVAWKGKDGPLTVTVDGVDYTVDIAANDGATGNAPYTLSLADSDKYTIELSGLTSESTITFATGDSAKRAIVLGVNLTSR